MILRSLSLVLTLSALCSAAFAQNAHPVFASTERRAELPAKSAAAIEAAFAEYESVVFDERDLLRHLRAERHQVTFGLQLGGETWDVRLDEWDQRSDDYRLRVLGADGLVRELPRGPNVTWRGRTLDGADREVVLTVAEDFVSGFVVEPGGADAVYFQSQRMTDPDARPDDLLIYRGRDAVMPAEHGCGTDDLPALEGKDPAKHQGHGHQAGARRAAGQCYEVELAIASDHLMYQAYGSNIATLEARNLGVVADFNADFSGNFADDYVHVVVTQFVSTSASSTPWTTSNDAGQLLQSFRQWGNAGNFGVSFDLGAIWTDRNFSGSTIGVAYVGAVCTSFRYQALQDFSSSQNLTRVLVSHETGHNYDCNHDASGAPHIMAPAVQNTNTWSPASINAVDAFGPSRTCLGTCSGGGGGSPPTASFTVDRNLVCAGGQVTYTSTSTGATSLAWSFPGGAPATSTQPTVTVTYPNVGTYSATLTATNATGSDTETLNGIVTVDPQPVVSFAASVVSPLTVAFTNNSSGASSYLWEFGDGNTSIAFEPTHVYAASASYTVRLTGFAACGDVLFEQVVSVITPPTADFSAAPTQGCAPLVVQFNDASSGNVAGYNWSFPGGVPASSTQRNPVVLYDTPGDYDVTLTVGNAGGTDTKTEVGLISVGGAPSSGFSVSVSGATVSITDNSAGATTVGYAFGDGTFSTDPNATHTYATGGTYTIQQTATNACGSVTSSQTVTVSGGPTASFATFGELCLGQTATIPSTSTGNPTAFQWTVIQPDGTPLFETGDPLSFVADQRGTYQVSLTVTNAAGTDTYSDANAAVVLDAPTAAFTQSVNGLEVSVAATVTPVLSSAGATYSWDFGDGSFGVGRQVAHTYAQPGVYAVTLSADNGCESAVATQTVTVGAAPSVTISLASGSTTTCVGQPAQIVASVNGQATAITWTLPGSATPTASGATASPVYAAAGNYAVSVEVCNGVGCSTATLSGGLDVLAAPTAGFSVTGSGALGIQVTSTTTAAQSVSYDFGDGGSSSDPDPVHSYAQPGTYVVTQTVSGPCGSDVATQTVSVGQSPTANFTVSGSGATRCPGATVAFQEQSTGQPTSYAWTFPGGTPSTSSAPNPSVTYASAGTYAATLTVTNALGSDTYTVSDAVTIAPLPQADFAATVAGLAVSLTNLSAGATSLSWDFGDGSAASTAAAPTYAYQQSGTYTVTLTATNACGTDIATQQVTVLAAPVAVVQQSGTRLCAGGRVTFDASSSSEATGYAWTFLGGTPVGSVSAPVVEVVYPDAGTYSVRLVVSNAAGADTLDLAGAVTVDPLPVAGFAADVTMLSVAVADASAFASGIAYDFGDGTTAVGPTASHTYASAGTYTITQTVTNGCGQDVTTRTVVVARGLPSANFTVTDATGCAPLTVQLDASASSEAEDYAWILPGSNESALSGEQVFATYAVTGRYDVTLVVSNSTGADTLVLAEAVEVIAPPTAVLQVPQVTGLAVDFQVGITGGSSVDWDFGDGALALDAGPQVSHSYAAPGEYRVVVEVTGACGIARDTVEVLVGAVPDAEFGVDINEGCAPLTVTLTDLSTGRPDAWAWTVTGPDGTLQVSQEQNPSFTLVAPGTYDVTLVATNAAGSATEVSFDFVEVLAGPTAVASVVSTSELAVQFGSITTAADSLDWDFGDGSPSTSVMDPLHSYAQAGTYHAVLTAFGPCGVASDTVAVVVESSAADGELAGATWRVHPNPFDDMLLSELVGTVASDVTMVIRDALGRQVYWAEPLQAGPVAFRQNIDTSTWPPGMYYVTLRGARRQVVRAVVKQ